MARRNISLPDDLDAQARTARLNVSALAQRAIAEELDRRQRMVALDMWLDELDATYGVPSSKARAKAQGWFDSVTSVEPRRGSARTTTPPAQAAS